MHSKKVASADGGRSIQFGDLLALIQRLEPDLAVKFRGASKADMVSLATLLGRPLPAAYSDFVGCFGRGAGEDGLLDNYDFSLKSLVEALRECDPHDGAVLPIAVCLDDGPDFLVLYPPTEEDPSVYTAWSLEDKGRLWCSRFSHWAAGQILIRTLIARRKYQCWFAPEPTWKYMGWTRVVDVDLVVVDLLRRNGFSELFPGSGAHILISKNHEIAIYRRRRGERVFRLYLGADVPGLLEGLRAELATTLRNNIILMDLDNG